MKDETNVDTAPPDTGEIEQESPATTTKGEIVKADLHPVPTGERETLLPPLSVIERLTLIANAVGKAGVFGIRKPEEAFARLLLGWEHGLGAMTALAEIDIIDGRPALNARTQAALVRLRKLGSIEVETIDDMGCVVVVSRSDWPARRKEKVSYTVEDAVAAGKMRRVDDTSFAAAKPGSNWAKDRQAMLQARALSRAARRYFQELFLGLPYSQEELSDEEPREVNIQVQFEKPVPPWEEAAQQQAAKETAPSSPAGTPDESSSAGRPEPAEKSPDRPDEPAIPNPPPSGDPATSAAPATSEKATEEQINQANAIIESLRRAGALTPEEWNARMRAHGAARFRDLRQDAAESVLNFARNLHTVLLLKDTAVAEKVMTEADWQAALQKRGVQRPWDLKPADVITMRQKLEEKVSPFGSDPPLDPGNPPEDQIPY